MGFYFSLSSDFQRYPFCKRTKKFRWLTNHPIFPAIFERKSHPKKTVGCYNQWSLYYRPKQRNIKGSSLIPPTSPNKCRLITSNYQIVIVFFLHFYGPISHEFPPQTFLSGPFVNSNHVPTTTLPTVTPPPRCFVAIPLRLSASRFMR